MQPLLVWSVTCIAHAGLECTIVLLPQPPWDCNYRYMPLHLVGTITIGVYDLFLPPHDNMMRLESVLGKYKVLLYVKLDYPAVLLAILL